MQPETRKFLSLSLFLLANFLIVFLSVITLPNLYLSDKTGLRVIRNPSETLITSSYSFYTAIPETPFPSEAVIVAGDARSRLVDKFLAHYRSTMSGLGSAMVASADKYQLPYGLVPAIAMCEGNLGKRTPEGSFNTWGYGIYGDKVLKFKSWQDGIETVSRGLRKNFLDKGLTTPEQIMTKYTPSSNGSWAECVQQFLNELR